MSVTINRPEALDLAPAGVLFDTDNTLYSYVPSHAKAMEATRDKACEMLGIDPAEFDEVFGKARQEIKDRLGETASSHSRLLYFQRFIEMLGMRTQLLLTLDLEQTYWRTFLTNCELFHGLVDLLHELRASGVTTAVVTDLTAQIQFRKLIYLGLEEYFDYVVTSEESGHDKPHAGSFELAVEKMGADPARLWMIGDDGKSDIVGAREAIAAVTFQKRHDGVDVVTGPLRADVVFDRFDEVREIFGKAR